MTAPRADDPAATRQKQLPLWGREVAIQAAGSALGTLIALLALFLGGVLFGLIENVDSPSVFIAGAALVGALIGMAAAIRASGVAATTADRQKLYAEINEARRLQDRSTAWTEQASTRARNAETTAKQLHREALAAERRGDTAAAEAMLEEALSLAATVSHETEVARQQADRTAEFVDRVEAHARRYGFEPEDAPADPDAD